MVKVIERYEKLGDQQGFDVSIDSAGSGVTIMNGQRTHTSEEVRAFRSQTYTAVVVPPTMYLVAVGLAIALAMNWLRGRPNLTEIAISTVITISAVFALAPLLRSLAGIGRTYATGVVGLVYVLILSLHLNLIAHWNHNGIQQSMALSAIIAVASTFFWAWEWQFVLGLICIMGPPAFFLFFDAYPSDTRYVQSQTIVVTLMVCTACYLYVRASSVRSFELLREVEFRASFDALTGLLNRSGWFSRAEAAMATDMSAALLFVDLDQFKIVNDREGHVAGDQLLRRVAELLTITGQLDEFIGRLGGDEFVLFLPQAGEIVAAKRAEQIRDAIDSIAAAGSGISASIGIAVREPGESLDSLINRADSQMFEVKARGRMNAS